MMQNATSNFVEEGRLGKFEVAEQLIAVKPSEAMRLMAKMVVVRADPTVQPSSGEPFVRTILYTAYSPMFDSLRQGDIVPRYAIDMSGEISAKRLKSPHERIAELETELEDAKAEARREPEEVRPEVHVVGEGQA
jgi:hypothetical protein